MDDGLQHTTLHRDLSFLVVDSEYLLGNNRVLPAGPLREPFERALQRANAVIALSPVATKHATLLTEPPAETDLRAQLGLPLAFPLLRAALSPCSAAVNALAGKRVVAFSGTARPERFFNALRALGCDLVLELPMADHASLPHGLLAELVHTARTNGALLVTTQKDAVRLEDEFRSQVCVLPLEFAWLGNSASVLDKLIHQALREAQNQPS